MTVGSRDRFGIKPYSGRSGGGCPRRHSEVAGRSSRSMEGACSRLFACFDSRGLRGCGSADTIWWPVALATRALLGCGLNPVESEGNGAGSLYRALGDLLREAVRLRLRQMCPWDPAAGWIPRPSGAGWLRKRSQTWGLEGRLDHASYAGHRPAYRPCTWGPRSRRCQWRGRLPADFCRPWVLLRRGSHGVAYRSPAARVSRRCWLVKQIRRIRVLPLRRSCKERTDRPGWQIRCAGGPETGWMRRSGATLSWTRLVRIEPSAPCRRRCWQPLGQAGNPSMLTRRGPGRPPQSTASIAFRMRGLPAEDPLPHAMRSN